MQYLINEPANDLSLYLIKCFENDIISNYSGQNIDPRNLSARLSISLHEQAAVDRPEEGDWPGDGRHP